MHTHAIELSIDNACYICYRSILDLYSYRSIMHTMHAIDRWSMSYMLSIDACLCYRSRCMSCFRSMMHAYTCYRSMMHAIFIDWWSILMLLIDDTCYRSMTSCYRSTMHVLCYRSMMHNLWWCMLYMLSIDDACHVIDPWWCMLMLSIYDACYMLSFDYASNHAIYDAS